MRPWSSPLTPPRNYLSPLSRSLLALNSRSFLPTIISASCIGIYLLRRKLTFRCCRAARRAGVTLAVRTFAKGKQAEFTGKKEVGRRGVQVIRRHGVVCGNNNMLYTRGTLKCLTVEQSESDKVAASDAMLRHCITRLKGSLISGVISRYLPDSITGLYLQIASHQEPRT